MLLHVILLFGRVTSHMHTLAIATSTMCTSSECIISLVVVRNSCNCVASVPATPLAAMLVQQGFVVVPMFLLPEWICGCGGVFLEQGPGGKGVVVAAAAWHERDILMPKVSQVRKDWDGRGRPAGERTHVRMFRNREAASECASVIAHTLHLATGRQYSVPLSAVVALQNEARAGAQMLHFDLPLHYRQEALTVDCALCEPFVVTVVPLCTGVEHVVPVPLGCMLIMHGWCCHAGTAAAAGRTGPRVFALAKDSTCPVQTPGTYPPPSSFRVRVRGLQTNRLPQLQL